MDETMGEESRPDAESPIAILGAGTVGGNLGVRLSESGFAVHFGVRPGKDCRDLLERCPGPATATVVEEAVSSAEVVFVCVGSEEASEVVTRAGGLAGKIVVDCTNPVAWGEEEGPLWDPPFEGSVAAELAASFPEARIVKGFCTFGAYFHRTATVASRPVDVPLASDDEEAKRRLAEIARRAGFDPWDAGPLECAGVLEALALLWIRRSRAGAGQHFTFQPVSDES